MNSIIKAIETTGLIDKKQRLILDDPVPISETRKVKVIILYPEDNDIKEDEWLKTAAKNQAFDFLNEMEEDIYTINDGQPFND